eukprot:scaffold1132_cov377-Prasinococcus_capsulatus_cf.AAC.7
MGPDRIASDGRALFQRSAAQGRGAEHVIRIQESHVERASCVQRLTSRPPPAQSAARAGAPLDQPWAEPEPAGQQQQRCSTGAAQWRAPIRTPARTRPRASSLEEGQLPAACCAATGGALGNRTKGLAVGHIRAIGYRWTAPIQLIERRGSLDPAHLWAMGDLGDGAEAVGMTDDNGDRALPEQPHPAGTGDVIGKNEGLDGEGQDNEPDTPEANHPGEPHHQQEADFKKVDAGPDGARNQPARPPDSQIYVGGLLYSMTSTELGDAFKRFGVVVDSKVIYDRESGRSKGYGFVEFEDPASVAPAISEMSGSDLNGRKIVVNHASGRTGVARERPAVPSDRDSWRGGPHERRREREPWASSPKGRPPSDRMGARHNEDAYSGRPPRDGRAAPAAREGYASFHSKSYDGGAPRAAPEYGDRYRAGGGAYYAERSGPHSSYSGQASEGGREPRGGAYPDDFRGRPGSSRPAGHSRDEYGADRRAPREAPYRGAHYDDQGPSGPRGGERSYGAPAPTRYDQGYGRASYDAYPSYAGSRGSGRQEAYAEAPPVLGPRDTYREDSTYNDRNTGSSNPPYQFNRSPRDGNWDGTASRGARSFERAPEYGGNPPQYHSGNDGGYNSARRDFGPVKEPHPPGRGYNAGPLPSRAPGPGDRYRSMPEPYRNGPDGRYGGGAMSSREGYRDTPDGSSRGYNPTNSMGGEGSYRGRHPDLDRARGPLPPGAPPSRPDRDGGYGGPMRVPRTHIGDRGRPYDPLYRYKEDCNIRAMPAGHYNEVQNQCYTTKPSIHGIHQTCQKLLTRPEPASVWQVPPTFLRTQAPGA